MARKRTNGDDPAGPLFARLRAAPGDVAARNAIVEMHLPIVARCAGRLHARVPPCVEYGELFSAGVDGLLAAIGAFDRRRRVKFSTYCVPRIHGAMLDYLREVDHVPRLVRTQARTLEAARQACWEETGRAPTPDELAAWLRVSRAELERLVRDGTPRKLVSLARRMASRNEEFEDLEQTAILEGPRAEDPLRRMECAELLRRITRGCNRRERLLLILYYYEQLTMKEIGRTLGLSESRVSQMHTALLARLKNDLRRHPPEFLLA
jgi:RNA polymerase sigma factor for flagellar operon FliA